MIKGINMEISPVGINSNYQTKKVSFKSQDDFYKMFEEESNQTTSSTPSDFYEPQVASTATPFYQDAAIGVQSEKKSLKDKFNNLSKEGQIGLIAGVSIPTLLLATFVVGGLISKGKVQNLVNEISDLQTENKSVEDQLNLLKQYISDEAKGFKKFVGKWADIFTWSKEKRSKTKKLADYFSASDKQQLKQPAVPSPVSGNASSQQSAVLSQASSNASSQQSAVLSQASGNASTQQSAVPSQASNKNEQPKQPANPSPVDDKKEQPKQQAVPSTAPNNAASQQPADPSTVDDKKQSKGLFGWFSRKKPKMTPEEKTKAEIKTILGEEHPLLTNFGFNFSTEKIKTTKNVFSKPKNKGVEIDLGKNGRIKFYKKAIHKALGEDSYFQTRYIDQAGNKYYLYSTDLQNVSSDNQTKKIKLGQQYFLQDKALEGDTYYLVYDSDKQTLNVINE